ncbi:multidrug resistance efflux transporter family protein [Fictibacillus sp. KIGAM418]|uniref:Multidrug resistance efflux transporter family protein n=1 Tax=Fictibacillus marinisediminis TaxID=2878389 RepID=A0A9X1XAB4_9BACL|nr:multidrug resistance efflux transporter family protein [Fictibacillus marinisediminis]MCK6256130.1 multidrug resistance efflux transporter family protein [Fictibacillus marinisediminis]
MRPVIVGICSAFFFAFTFVLNRLMELSGGSWIWSASLRYFFMVPFLLIIVMLRGNLGQLMQTMKEQTKSWLLWSLVGFGLFYAPICFAAAYEPGWLIAGTWQITIISGSLLVPFFKEQVQTSQGLQSVRGKIPFKGLSMSLVILLGIVLMQMEQAGTLSFSDVLLGVLPVLVASFAYPLGNRKMMELCGGRLDAYQRVLGMTLASLPFWIVLAVIGWFADGPPTAVQTFQSALVALSSGVIATVLFFYATDLVRGNMQQLAAVEATQSAEVLFAAMGEIWLLSLPMPSALSWLGMALIMVGMILHSYVSRVKKRSSLQKANIS